MPESHSLKVVFECVDLPTGAWVESGLRLGIQEGTEVRGDVSCADGQAQFEFSLIVSLEPERVVYRGKYAQGPVDERFVYLCWGDRSTGAWVNSRRAKIPLGVIDRSLVEVALQQGVPIHARIVMTNAKGEPVAATLKTGLTFSLS